MADLIMVKVQIPPLAMAAAAGVLVAGFLIWRGAGKAAELAKDVGQAINPANPDNGAASAVNAVGGALASDPDAAGKNADGSWSLGGWVWDMTHKDPVTGK